MNYLELQMVFKKWKIIYIRMLNLFTLKKEIDDKTIKIK